MCNKKFECLGVAFVISLVIGIITAFLRITAVITVPPVFLWATFGIAVGFIAVALFSFALSKKNTLCVETALGTTLASALSTILFSIVLLAITFVATSIVGAIITGLLLLSFSFLLTSAACLTKCLAKVND